MLIGGILMVSRPKYYIVEAAALPEVFLKVAEAKRLLSTGEAGTVNEATKITGISRSAFYKYRDTVMPFHNMMIGRILTYQLKLHDEPGVLSGILRSFAEYEANILTINQTIPSGGCALVTITAETSGMKGTPDELLRKLSVSEGVVKAEVLAG